MWMLYVLLLCVFLTQALAYLSFDKAFMYLTPKKIKTPLDITIEFRAAIDIPPDKIIAISLPRFTRDLKDNNITYGNITYSNLIISPSYIFDAKFVEGVPFYDKDGNMSLPYSASMILLKSAINATISAFSLIPLRIYKENGIGVVCGFPDSQTLSSYVNSIEPFKGFKMFTLDTFENSNITIKNEDSLPFTYYDGIGQGCIKLDDCSGHGKCNYCYETCTCTEGYGAITDIAPKGTLNPNCADRVCPYGKAIGDLATAPNKAHSYAECSNQGICDRKNGTCSCFPPFTGAACEKLGCPRGCSGHGQCVTISDISRMMAKSSIYRDTKGIVYGTGAGVDTYAWDYNTMQMCLCDSSWPVGVNAGERQLSEYFGADCSLKRCPSGDDPFTTVNETNCYTVSQRSPLSGEKGRSGSICHIDCSNRGICDYHTGKCTCFPGSWGDACDKVAGAGRHAFEAGWDTGSFALANGNDSIIVEGN